ncbi:MAG: DUF3842 family protein [Lachnospiraceae bacterium]|nr:DUF3842 family protein [Lachnospiraceae bacterium]
MTNILVIDAQGGGVGRQLVAGIRQQIPDAYIMAVGANTAATSAMLRAGADISGTGENSVRTACRSADIITGPIGIVIADSMLGEITPGMALAVAQSSASQVLIPFSHRGRKFVGMPEVPLGKLISEAVEEIRKLAGA